MTPHLRNHVRAYVDRALPPALLHLYDRHLVCCAMCRAAADQERRIVASLRAETGIPHSLRSSLMGLVADPALAAAPVPAPRGVSFAPRIPLPPRALRMPSAASHEPVPTVAPTAPALHRSPMRAAVVASIAAGASVAAAWGLAISPLPGGARPATAGVPSGVASFGAVNPAMAGFPSTRLAPGSGTNASSRGNSASGAVGTGSVRTTESTAPAWMVSQVSVRSVQQGGIRLLSVRSAQSGP